MRGIVFDIDDTLYCRQDMLVKAAETVLGVKVPDWREFIRIFYEKSEINMSALESGEVSTHDINGWRYNETFRLLGLPYKQDDGGKAADTYLELQSHMVISDGLAGVLDKIAKDSDIRLGILTAGESRHQWNKVGMLGLNRWFSNDYIIVTGDTPYTKPDKELYKMMEERLDLSPSDLWMIGDNYDKDIKGAIENNWHTLWLNRRGLPDPEHLPDISVLTDEEFIAALAKEFT